MFLSFLVEVSSLLAQVAPSQGAAQAGQQPNILTVIFIVLYSLALRYWPFVLAGLILFLALHIYVAICLAIMAKKTGTKGRIMAWIPLLNIYLMCKVAGKSGVWVLLLFIPVVNLILFIVLWVEIAKRLGRSGAWGVLTIVPVLGLFVPAILAGSKVADKQKVSSAVSAPIPSAGGGEAIPLSQVRKGKISGKIEKSFCTECGTGLEPGEEFCTQCGNKV